MKTSKILILTIIAVMMSLKMSAQNPDSTASDLDFKDFFDNLNSDGETGTAEFAENTQDNSNETLLYNFKRLYNAGKYSEAIKTAKTLNKTKFNSKENSEFLKYYASTLKEAGFDREADSVTKLFLKKNPFYETQVSDPMPFKEMKKNFYTFPRFATWINFGLSTPMVIIDTVHVINEDSKNKPDYSSTEGFIAEIGFQYYITKFVSVAAGLQYNFMQYTRTENHSFYYNSMKLDYKFVYKESSHLLTVPVYVTITYPTRKEKIVPEFYAGFQQNYLLKTKYESYNEYGESQQNTISDNSIDLKTKNRINCSVFGGLRINRNFNQNTFFADASFSYMLRPFNNAEYNYYNHNLLYNKMFVPDAIHLATFNIRVGYKFKFGYSVKAKYGYGF
ncbi:MAG: outer membrane beta-barrel protein [Bacteroidales bacterium]|nr:outer membrane beta-barrel protein [Bacteroidales bacterium]